MFPTTACCFSFAVLGRRLSQDWNDGVVGGGDQKHVQSKETTAATGQGGR